MLVDLPVLDNSVCNSRFTIDGGDSQDDLVQAIDNKVQTLDRKLENVSTTLRKHTAGAYHNLQNLSMYC